MIKSEVHISYDRAQKTVSDALKKEDRLSHYITNSISLRCKNGYYRAELKTAKGLYRSEKSEEAKHICRYCLAQFLLGKKFAERFLSRKNVLPFKKYMDNAKVVYVSRSPLYHCTPAENIKSIKERGLIAVDKPVCMTFDKGYLLWFMHYKTVLLKKDVTYRVLKIDAEKLSKRRELYYYRDKVIAAEKVEPEYITVL